MIKYIASIFLLFLVFSCNEKPASLAINPSKKLNLDISEQINYLKKGHWIINLESDFKESVFFEEYFDVHQFVFIDDQFLVGNIEKLIYFEDRFFFYDKISETIFCINMHGEVLWTITNQGEGPNEYQKISDFDLDFNLDELHLWDAKSQKVLVFNTSNSNLLKVNQNHSFGSAFIAMNNRYFFYPLGYYDEDQAFNILVSDRENNLIGRALPFEPFDYDNSFLQEKSFSKSSHNTFHFSRKFNDTLYYYGNDTLYAQFVFQRNGKSTPKYVANSNVEDYYRSIRESQVSTSAIDNFIQVGHNIFFTFKVFDNLFSRFKIYNGVIDLLTKETKVFDNFDSHPLLWNNQYSIDLLYSNDEFSFVTLDPANFSTIRKNWNKISSEGYLVSQYFKENYPELHEIIIKTNDESNPIIVLLKNK